MQEKYLNDTSEYFCEHRVSTDWAMERSHFHKGYEIFYSDTDGIQFFVNSKVYAVNRGDLLVFSSRDLHRAMIPRAVEYDRYYLIFDPKYVSDISTDTTDLLLCFEEKKQSFSIHLTSGQQERLRALFARCAENAEPTGRYGSDIRKKMALIDLLLYVNLLFSGGSLPNHSIKTGSSGRIREIQKYIVENPAEDLSLEALSAKFYISKRHLEHTFKEYCGFSVGEYIANIRILRACELLKAGAGVSQAGEQVGYGNPSHFSRTFRSHTGISPKKYSQSGG